MRKIIFIMLILVTMAFCKDKNETKNEKVTLNHSMIEQSRINLVGKTLEYNYGDYIYQINFKSSDKLHWKCIKGEEKGKEADENYFVQRLSNHTFFVSWVESDRLGVSQVVNLKDNLINCFLKMESEIIPLSGTIRKL